MKPQQIFEELLNMRNGSLSNAISSEDEYSKITLYVSLLVHKNIQYSKVYLGDKLLGTINKYRYKKLDNESGVDEEDPTDDTSALFVSMMSSYLNVVRINDNLIKTIIIFLVDNNYINEFRNIRKLSESQWGIKTIEYINNLSVSSTLITDSFIEIFKDYPIHQKIIKDRIRELIITNNFRERYMVLMADAWKQGELSASDPIETELCNRTLELRTKVRNVNINIKVKDLCDLLEIGQSTYRNRKNDLIKSLSKYYYNSIYSNLIDLINSMK